MARGPQIHQMVRATVIAAMAASLLLLAPGSAGAGEDDPSGTSRSTAPTQGYTQGSTVSVDGFAAGAMDGTTEDGTTTSIDGFAAGSTARSVDLDAGTDGWANRSTTPVRDGWEVARMKLPQPTTVTDGWAFRSAPTVSRDGWEVARIELPKPVAVTDGWAYRSDASDVNLASLDGWAYGTVTAGPEAPQPRPVSAPPRQTSPPFAEIALAIAVALLAMAGAGFIHHRHQTHLPV